MTQIKKKYQDGEIFNGILSFMKTGQIVSIIILMAAELWKKWTEGHAQLVNKVLKMEPYDICSGYKFCCPVS
jgi:hypothetical protein